MCQPHFACNRPLPRTSPTRFAQLLIQLYNKGVWTDERNVNVIASATLSDYPKVAHAAIRFFLRTNEELEHDAASDSDDEDAGNAQKEYNRIMQANERNKKSGKRKKRMEKALKSVKRAERRATQAPSFHFAALQHVNDPQVRY
jgi:protein SDA1